MSGEEDGKSKETQKIEKTDDGGSRAAAPPLFSRYNHSLIRYISYKSYIGSICILVYACIIHGYCLESQRSRLYRFDYLSTFN